MAQHTPGPWAVEDPMGANIGLWIVQDGLEAHQWSCIAAVTADHAEDRAHAFRFISQSEQTANARLISAAPNMLAALRAAEQFISNGIEFGYIKMPMADTRDTAHDTLPMIRAAIAKATGEA